MERDPADLIEAFFSGELDDPGTLALRAWLREDPHRFVRFAAESCLEAAINRVYQARRLQGAFDTADLFDELLRDAEAHPVKLVDITEQLERDRQRVEPADQPNLTLYEHRTTHIIIPKWVFYSGIAAVLGLAAMLFWPGKPQATPSRIAGNNSLREPAAPLPPAMLTTAQGAEWLGEILSVGDGLAANQRFQLIDGYAEITTRRGAVAILEAPCSVELMGDGHALYLHAGKLVGVCETESSKGFVVRTSQMDITDIGTRFGVDASIPGRTEVFVFDGEIEAVTPSSEAAQNLPVRFIAGDAIARTADGSYEPIPFSNTTFQYEKLRPAFWGFPTQWKGLPPADLRVDQAESDAVQVYFEHGDYLLTEDLIVDFTEGDWRRRSTPGQSVVSAGQRVDVYLIHRDPKSGDSPPAQFSVDFGRPILGVIADEQGLLDTDSVLGCTDSVYGKVRDTRGGSRGDQRGLDIHLNDYATISEDHRSIHVSMETIKKIDQIRVLVQASDSTGPADVNTSK